VVCISIRQVNIVDPRKLTDELGEIFVSSVLAVNVSATFIVHRGLYVCLIISRLL